MLPAAPAAPSPPAPEKPDLSGFARVLGTGFITGPGPLSPADRCNSVMATVPGATFGDHVVVSPAGLTEEVVYTATVGTDSVTYQACYTGSGAVNIGGDVRYMVLPVN